MPSTLMSINEGNSLRTAKDFNFRVTEENFNSLLPLNLQKASDTFFTPVHVARMATMWLTENRRVNVLDVGAGVGKFCVVGANNSESTFYGVEYRPSLVTIANHVINKFEITNAVIYNRNVVDTDFSNFDAFYIFNPFFENLVSTKQLNNEIELNVLLYSQYLKYTEEQLDKAKSGTRLVTYHGNNFEVPSSYKKMKQSADEKLKLWVRS